MDSVQVEQLKNGRFFAMMKAIQGSCIQDRVQLP